MRGFIVRYLPGTRTFDQTVIHREATVDDVVKAMGSSKIQMIRSRTQVITGSRYKPEHPTPCLAFRLAESASWSVNRIANERIRIQGNDFEPFRGPVVVVCGNKAFLKLCLTRNTA